MSINLLITGDYCPIGRIQEKIDKGDFTSFFGDFSGAMDCIDFAITNLESPITNNDNALLKSGPNIKGPLNGVKPLKEIGFDLVTLANNHILDYGEKGVQDTVKACNDAGIASVGAGSSLIEARKIFYKKIKHKTFAFINLAENEFCAATQTGYGANPLNLITNQKDIKEAKNNADYVIVIAHGGREHYQLPTPLVRERYRFFIDSGADAVVGHHPHCYSGYELYNGKNIFYSLGNFIFDYKKKYQKGHWTEGMAVILKISDNKIDFDLHPFFQGRQANPDLELIKGEDLNKFNHKIEELNTIIKDDILFYDSWNNYIETQTKSYNAFLFYKNKYLQALYSRGLLPFKPLVSNKRKALLLNLQRCETHNEITTQVLKKQIGEQ